MWFKSNPKDESQITAPDTGAAATVSKGSSRKDRVTRAQDSRAMTIMKAMSNSQRLQILSHLINGEERSVKELEEIIKTLSQSALSQHLGRLRRANILKTRRDSQMVFYSIEDNNVRELVSLLNTMYDKDPVLKMTMKKH